MSWDFRDPLFANDQSRERYADDPPIGVSGQSRISAFLGGILHRMRVSRGPLIFAAVIQFLIAATNGVLGIGGCFFLIVNRVTDADWYALFVLCAGLAVLHVILGVGMLRMRVQALVTSLWLSAPWLVITFLLATPPAAASLAERWMQRPAICALVLIVITDFLTVLKLKRAN